MWTVLLSHRLLIIFYRSIFHSRSFKTLKEWLSSPKYNTWDLQQACTKTIRYKNIQYIFQRTETAEAVLNSRTKKDKALTVSITVLGTLRRNTLMTISTSKLRTLTRDPLLLQIKSHLNQNSYNSNHPFSAKTNFTILNSIKSFTPSLNPFKNKL